MDPLSILAWILAAIGALVLLTSIAIVVLFVGLFIFGFRLLRDEEATQLPGRTDR
ncbi:hypothetical protein [uncultured Microbacterium sp.]|uniref:hypothetical protein n=1 Tax=uncultured Microbacterium sp. TaxID=191216 RepID=UPI0025EB6C63|nr:hypothetical protein [uncultured Microbacterium sp.]